MLQSNLEPKIQQKILKDPALNSDNNKSWHLLSRIKHWTAARILCFLVQNEVSLIEEYNASKCRFFFFYLQYPRLSFFSNILTFSNDCFHYFVMYLHRSNFWFGPVWKEESKKYRCLWRLRVSRYPHVLFVVLEIHSLCVQVWWNPFPAHQRGTRSRNEKFVACK